MRTLTRFAASLLTLAAVGCSGSGDGLPREPISGQVSLDGQPLDKGMITFTPLNAPNAEPIVSALLNDGAFSLSRAEGPIAGPHRVDVWARQPSGKKVRDPDNPAQFIDEIREVVPPRYNLRSELTAEVKPGADNTFTFELKADKGGAKKKDPKLTRYVPTASLERR